MAESCFFQNYPEVFLYEMAANSALLYHILCSTVPDFVVVFDPYNKIAAELFC